MVRSERGWKRGVRAAKHLEAALELLGAQVGSRRARQTDVAHRTNAVTSFNVGTPNSSRVVVAAQRTQVRQGADRTAAEEHDG